VVAWRHGRNVIAVQPLYGYLDRTNRRATMLSGLFVSPEAFVRGQDHGRRGCEPTFPRLCQSVRAKIDVAFAIGPSIVSKVFCLLALSTPKRRCLWRSL
jgi:hypothetical protein